MIATAIKIDPDSTPAERIEKLDTHFWQAWSAAAPRIHPQFVRYVALRNLKKEIKNIVFGYGPLEDLLRLPIVSEIMVVDREHIFVERNGVLQDSGRRFVSDEAIESIIQRIVSRVGRRIDKSQPLVDARLRDGSRVNAVISPIAVSGPCLTVRKFPANKLHIRDLIAKGSMSPTLAQFLRGIVLSHRNIIVSGGTGTGKTTLLNCLSDFIPDAERVVTVEDTAELRLSGDHVVRLETKDANVEGRGEYTIRDLVKNALRMRPDRIVVGECRGAEALDMLQAMNTGHDGSLTTVHANNARDAMLRLEVLVQTAADLPLDSIRRQIAAAVDVVVQLTRLRDGRRCITQVAEILDVNPRTGQIETRELFRLPELHQPGRNRFLDGSTPQLHRIACRCGALSVGSVLSVGRRSLGANVGARLMFLLAAGLTIAAAVALATLSIGPAWDSLSRRHIADLSELLKRLAIEDRYLETGMRIWGAALLAVPIVFVFVLQMAPLAIPATAMIYVAPKAILKAAVAQRRKKIRDQLVAATSALANACRAGLSLSQGIAMIADETPDPLASELKRISREEQHGRPLIEAIRDTKNRLRLDSFTLLSTSLLAALERGGPITEVLDTIGKSLQEHQRVEGVIDSETAGHRRVVWILVLFPIALLGMFQVMHPIGVEAMLGTLVGQIVLTVIVGLLWLTVWWSNRILDIEV